MKVFMLHKLNMKLVLKKGKFFKKLIEFCKDLIPSGNLSFNRQDGISLNSLDTNKVALIFFQINKEAFSTFELTEDFTLSISFERLCKIFKTYNDSDTMTIKKKKDDNKLTFLFKNSTTKKTATHKVPLLNLSNEQIEIPDEKESDEGTIINITPMTIANITKDCAMFGDTIKIKTIEGDSDLDDPNQIKFYVEDLEGDAEYLYEENEEDIQTINIIDNVNCTFMMSYLVKFAKFSSIADSLVIKLKNDNPISYHFKIPIGEVKLFLSPKIQD